ncbi:hypothetical protein UlMin_005533 [Ulmus minor]
MEEKTTEKAPQVSSELSNPPIEEPGVADIPELKETEEDHVDREEKASPTTIKVEEEAREASTSEALEEDNGRERLKKHRVEVAGSVWIPDIWGQEELLKDWIDCSAFDDSLVPNGIVSARRALVQEGRRATSGGLRIENRC